jgi:signal transduction histidine kinase
VLIHLECAEGRLLLRVIDNGLGFPKVMSRHDGMGLRIMRYRAGIIGGLLSVEPHSDGGTLVSCTMPLRTSPGSADSPAPSRGQPEFGQ